MNTGLASAQVGTLRLRLLKISGRIESSVRRIVIHLAAAHPWARQWQHAARAYGAVRRPQSNGFIEHLHRTLLDEHSRLKGREKFYESVAEMQVDLAAYLAIYKTKRPHQGRGMKGMTPLRAFQKGLKLRPKTEGKEEPKEAA